MVNNNAKPYSLYRLQNGIRVFVSNHRTLESAKAKRKNPLNIYHIYHRNAESGTQELVWVSDITLAIEPHFIRTRVDLPKW